MHYLSLLALKLRIRWNNNHKLEKEPVVVSIGITLNPSARNKFFLIVPEIARLTEEAKNMAGLTRQKKQRNIKI